MELKELREETDYLDQVDSILDRYRCHIDMLNTFDSSLSENSPLFFIGGDLLFSLSPVGNTQTKDFPSFYPKKPRRTAWITVCEETEHR